MAFYECFLLPADLVDFPIGAILHENQSLGECCFSRNLSSTLVYSCSGHLGTLFAVAAKAFGKIGA